MSKRIEIKKLCRALKREGYTVTRTAGSHLRITHPAMSGPVFTGTGGNPDNRHAQTQDATRYCCEAGHLIASIARLIHSIPTVRG